MGYGKKSVEELWAVMDKSGAVLYSRGGSSSTPRLMVYPSEQKAQQAVNNSWIKQIIPDYTKISIVRVYKRGE